LNSINKSGAEAYIQTINQARLKFKDLILIPGSESVPYYYWTGSYFKKDLTAHDHEKRLLTIGLEISEDYENLPIIHNGFSTRYVKRALPGMLFFFGSLFLGLYLLAEKGFIRIAAGFIVVFSLLAILNTAPLRSSPYTPYMGKQGIAPYQHFIDHVDRIGGMTFWNYPETRSGVRPYGPIHLNTPPYPDVLEQARGYTGFAAIYGDTITITKPGHEWDKVLMAYCRGQRARPVWGIATADYHSEEDSEKLGNFPTVFLVREKTQAAVLAAMRAGRMYAVRGPYPQRLILDEFSICADGCNETAVSGQEIQIRQPARIRVALSLKIPEAKEVVIRLIHGGKLIKTLETALPAKIEFRDSYSQPGEKTFYRVEARARGAGRLVSNPIFVKFVSEQQ
ncbi:MAG: hypothetical protein GY697_27610, partial [Desulfobacterales bacterium]|nr:hypothetical protein [Desulfobacterales bacterium]